MKLTFTDMQNIAKENIGLTDSTTLIKIKRDINIGCGKLLAALGREYNRKERSTNLVAGQQYYQFPEDAQKLKELVAAWSSSYSLPLEQVPDEHAWRLLNQMSVTGNPTHFFLKGFDEIGLYPIPSANVTNGLTLVFSPKHVELTQDDYTTGSIEVTEGSEIVTGTGTSFTSKMVGQWLQVTDGTDGNWYKVREVGSSTSITLDQYYQGTSGSAKTYRIGQVVDYPDEFAEAPSDFATYRHYKRRGDNSSADSFKALFMEATMEAQEQYSRTTDQQIVLAEPMYDYYNPFRGDAPPGGISA